MSPKSKLIRIFPRNNLILSHDKKNGIIAGSIQIRNASNLPVLFKLKSNFKKVPLVANPKPRGFIEPESKTKIKISFKVGSVLPPVLPENVMIQIFWAPFRGELKPDQDPKTSWDLVPPKDFHVRTLKCLLSDGDSPNSSLIQKVIAIEEESTWAKKLESFSFEIQLVVVALIGFLILEYFF